MTPTVRRAHEPGRANVAAPVTSGGQTITACASLLTLRVT